MKKFLKKIGAGLSSTIKNGAGFTLIELLIVIAVLGVLATAVLSAINPIEQINRGKDTGSRSDAEQLLSAIDRYYAAQGYYPWQTGEADTLHVATAWDVVDNTTWADTAAVPVPVLTKLSSGGTAELKTSFITRIIGTTYNTLYKYNHGDPGEATYICFPAKSGSFKTEANKRCSATGLETGDPAGGGLPADLVPMAANICVVATPKICLP